MAIELPALPYERERAGAAHLRRDPRLPLRQAPPGLRDEPQQADQGHRVRERLDLEAIIKKSQGGMFNNAAQVWNHTFYWNCLSAQGRRRADRQARPMRSPRRSAAFAKFKEEFTKTAVGTFGSGWAWLVQRPDGSLGHRQHLQRRHADHRQRQAAADLRRVGARLLHRLPQCAPEVRRGVLEPGRTGTSPRRTWPESLNCAEKAVGRAIRPSSQQWRPRCASVHWL